MSGDHENLRNKIHDNEDNRLKNWTNWQEKWKRIQGDIAGKLSLERGNLLMNYADDIQKYNQEKEILDCAKITTEFDKYRGNPDFYKLPEALPKLFKCSENRKCCCCCKLNENKRCCCNTEEPTYFLIKTRKEQNVVPPIDLVAVPKRPEDENNISTEARSIYKKWQNCKYRQEQLNKLSNKIQQIVPHWPNFEHLVVMGTRITAPVDEEPEESIPNQEAHYVTEVSSEVAVSQDDKLSGGKDSAEEGEKICRKPKLAFKIGDIILDSQAGNEGTKQIYRFFDYDLYFPKLQVQYLEFENNGLTTIRIHWKKIVKFRLFCDFVQEKWDKHGFYFNRQELIILPGQFVKFPIWFKTENVGIFSEQWEIHTKPEVWKDNFHLILILEGYSSYSNMKETMNNILHYIEIQSKNLLIKDILDDTLEKLKYSEKPVSNCVYGIAQLFELANLSNGRPIIFYNEEFFTELMNLYDVVKQNEEKWDFKLCALRKLAQKRDVCIYTQNKLTELQEKIRKIENDKPIFEAQVKAKSKKGKEKKSKKKSAKADKKSKKSKSTQSHSNTEEEKKLVEITREPYEYSNQAEFWKVLKKFDFPVIINTEKNKYFACFHILSSYFTKMCHQLESLESENNVIRKSSYLPLKNQLLPINEQPERLTYEYFENHYIPKITQEENYFHETRRKPKILKTIAEGDVESLYTTYFNKPLPSKKGDAKSQRKKAKGKKKKTVKTKSKKGSKSKGKKKKSGKGSKASKNTIPKEESILSFNPYCENFVYVPEIEELENSCVEEKINIPKGRLEDHKYQQYLIVYSCLSEAVEAVFDTLESFECVASYPTLNEVLTSSGEK